MIYSSSKNNNIILKNSIYKPFAHRTFYPSTQDLPYNQSPEEGKSPPFIREMSSDRIMSHSQLSISSTTSTTISLVFLFFFTHL